MADTPVTAEDEVKERVAYVSPYEQWKKAEGLPTYRGLAIQDLNALELVTLEVERRGLGGVSQSGGHRRL